ncbi:hypothetical protein HMI54_010917, partial [Coelomomyces lativittatus]
MTTYFKSKSMDEAVAGFTSGALTTLILHPLDLVKTQFQANTARSTSIEWGSSVVALKQIWKRNGYKGLYQGLSANFLGATLSWGLYFAWYNQIKQIMKQNASIPLAPYQHLLAAAQAGVLTSLCTNPFWLMKTRMCLQPFDKPHYTSVLAGLTSIARTEGIRGLYRGLLPSLFGVSHGAIQFMVYEEVKAYSVKHRATDHV